MGRIALNNGLLAGLIGVAISLLGTVTGIYDMSDDFQGERGWESTIVSAISFAVLIYFIIRATKEYRDTQLEGMMSYWDALKVGLLTGFIAAIVSALYLLIILTMIDPGLIEE
jgi:putative exporter of polyketide antibiotics